MSMAAPTTCLSGPLVPQPHHDATVLPAVPRSYSWRWLVNRFEPLTHRLHNRPLWIELNTGKKRVRGTGKFFLLALCEAQKSPHKPA